MTAQSKKGLPILLKRAEVSLPVQRVQVQATVIKTRDIHLLEWAILAPLASINPPPSLEEIVQELGIDLVDFLKDVAEQLKSTGLIQQLGVNRYQITDIGKKFFSEGKVVSDPRHIQVPIYYLADTKEWMSGFSGDIDLKALEENTSGWDLHDPDPDIGLPEKIITSHMRKRRDIEKNETIAEYTLNSTISDQIKFNANFLLKTDGIAIRPVDHPFGEENAQKISVALSRTILGSSRIQKYLSEFYDLATDVRPTRTVRPHEIVDAPLFTPASEDRLVEYLTAQKPQYLIVNRNIPVPDLRANVPLILTTKCSSPIKRGNTGLFQVPIYLRIEKLFPDYAYLTDTCAVRVVNVLDDHANVPLFMVEENPMQHEVAATLCEHIAGLDMSGPGERFERDLALFHLAPDAKSLEQVFRSLSTLKQGGIEFATYDKKELLQNIVALKKAVPGSRPSPVEINVVTDLLKSLTSTKLLEIGPEILGSYFHEYMDAVDEALSMLSYKKDLHHLLSLYPVITGRFRGYEKIHGDEVRRFNQSYLRIIARAFDQSAKDCSGEDLQSGITLLSGVISTDTQREEGQSCLSEFNSTDIKQEFGQSLLSAVTAAKLKRGEKVQILCKLSGMGITPSPAYVEQIGEKMFTDLNFDWFDPDLHKKVQATVHLCQSLNPSSEIEKYLMIPELSRCPRTKQEIKSFVTNLFAFHQSVAFVDSRNVSDVLQQVSQDLRNGETPAKLTLWVELLATVRPYEQKEGTRFIQVEDSEIVTALRPLDRDQLGLLKDNLESLGLSSHSLENRDEDRGNEQDKRSGPPINRVVIDGSNVAHAGQEKNTASADQVMQAYHDLKDLGFETVYIITGAGLRHAMGKDKYKEMERYFRRISKKTGKEILHQAPAKTDDDQFIITFAIDSDLLILTNDLYRDAVQKNPEFQNQIEGRLIKFMFNPENKALMISEYPDYSRTSIRTEGV